MTVDVKCMELARHFLSDIGREDDQRLVTDLAESIQESVEEFFADRELQT